MENEKVYIDTTYITLGQFIKLLNILDSGGMIKHFLQDKGVIVNGELDRRRGRKLYVNDTVEVNGQTFIVCKNNK